MSAPPPSDPWEALASTSDPEALRLALRPAISQFRSVPISELGSWTSSAISAWSETQNKEIVSFVFSEFIDEFFKWLLEDVDSRLDAFIHFTAVALDSPHRIEFLGQFATVVRNLFPDKSNIDLNFLLALQSPIFSYAVARQPDSGVVCEFWFHTLAKQRGVDIFGDNLGAALAYFKLMNHAFFQLSVTTTSSAKQEPMFIAVQDEMRAAVVAISRLINQ